MISDLSFHGIAASWWPFAFILLAGWLPTDIWRYLGVLTSGRLDEHSPLAAIVSAVIGQLVFYPTGAMADFPLPVRLSALGLGFIAYLSCGRRVLVGILTAEAVLFAGTFFS